MSTAQILVVDDEKAFRMITGTLLREENYEVDLAESGAEALELLQSKNYDLVMTDLKMEGMSGLELLSTIKEQSPSIYVMMITGFATIDTAIEAMKLGAYDYITKPIKNEELLIKIKHAIDDKRKSDELENLRSQVYSKFKFENIISHNSQMDSVFKLIQQVTQTDVSVLIRGETGTGKELVARAIHYNSPRKNKPFVAINCSAIPETLLESELFGHEKGAFTGAIKQRRGKFEEANRGTLFLDEIGDIPNSTQTKLLRVLQEREFQRVGGSEMIQTDVRIISATNKDLEVLIQQGKLREDFYYRINVFPIFLPPLRDRIDDILSLVDHFIKIHKNLAAFPNVEISPEAMHSLTRYYWPGNVRELENLIKRTLVTTDSNKITKFDFNPVVSTSDAEQYPFIEHSTIREYLKEITQTAEVRFLKQKLKEFKGDITEMAREIDLDRKTIYRKIEEYHIDLDEYRNLNTSKPEKSQ